MRGGVDKKFGKGMKERKRGRVKVEERINKMSFIPRAGHERYENGKDNVLNKQIKTVIYEG
jgi:hypothetical protein